jgi:hypothetical protein
VVNRGWCSSAGVSNYYAMRNAVVKGMCPGSTSVRAATEPSRTMRLRKPDGRLTSGRRVGGCRGGAVGGRVLLEQRRLDAGRRNQCASPSPSRLPRLPSTPLPPALNTSRWRSACGVLAVPKRGSAGGPDQASAVSSARNTATSSLNLRACGGQAQQDLRARDLSRHETAVASGPLALLQTSTRRSARAGN